MKVICISSFKGGTGKTSVSLHVGSCLSLFHKKKVLLIDFDAQANLSAGLGFDPDEQDSIATVFNNQKSIEKVILPTSIKNLDLIPADSWLERIELTEPLVSNRYAHERLLELIKTLDYDIVIIDTPPSLCWLSESALIAATHSLICTTAEFYSVKGLQRLHTFIKTIAKRHPLNIIGVCVSFWNTRGKNNNAFSELIESIFPHKLLSSRIRRDINISEASIHGKPVFSVNAKSRASNDYKNLTKEIIHKM